MQPCDDECGACDVCVEYLTARADDARADRIIQDRLDEKWQP